MKEGGWGGKKGMGGRKERNGREEGEGIEERREGRKKGRGIGEDMGDWWWKKGGVSIFLDSSLVFSHIFD